MCGGRQNWMACIHVKDYSKFKDYIHLNIKHNINHYKKVIIIFYLHITAAVWKIETVLEKKLIIREDTSTYCQHKILFGEEQKRNTNNFIFTIQDINPIIILEHWQ